MNKAIENFLKDLTINPDMNDRILYDFVKHMSRRIEDNNFDYDVIFTVGCIPWQPGYNKSKDEIEETRLDLNDLLDAYRDHGFEVSVSFGTMRHFWVKFVKPFETIAKINESTK